MIAKSVRKRRFVRWLIWILTALMISSGTVPVIASNCTDLAELPLMVSSVLSPPSLFMISFDNSGSMDFETMAKDGVADAQFADPVTGDAYGYVFQTSQHNSNAAVVELKRPGAWKSQWSGHNKLYYNPEVTYAPWPEKSNVATVSPLSDPMGDTYDLTTEFMTGVKLATVETVVKDQEQNGVNNGVNSNVLTTLTVTGSNAVVTIAQEVTCVNGLDVDGNSCVDSDELFIGPVTFTNTDDSNDVVEVLPADVERNGPEGGWVAQYDGWLTDGKPGFYSATWRVEGLTAGETYEIKASWNALDQRSDAVAYNIYYGSSGDIERRHFYVMSEMANGGDGFPYLVNLIDNDSAEFFKVDESIGATPGLVEDFELVKTAWADLPLDLKTLLPEPLAGLNNYADHLQNFANWFNYYRKRTYSAKNAVAQVVSNMSNILVGFTTNPPTTKIGVRWINVDIAGYSMDNTADFLTELYGMGDPGSESKFTDSILSLGAYFEGKASTITDGTKLLTEQPSPQPAKGYFADSDTYPYFTAEYGGQCQQAFALIITDGGSIGTSNINDYDSKDTDSKNLDTDYDGGIFADIDETTSLKLQKGIEDTMADGAMHYYERDLKPGLENVVPANYMDLATHQHMVTYGITFGVEGEIDRSLYPNCTAACAGGGCNCPYWPDPHDEDNGPNRGLDDLWHATVNGRGLYLNASDPQDLIEKLGLIKADIERRSGSAAAVATNAVQRQYGATIYQGQFDSRDWSGDLRALQIDTETGNIGSFVWTYNDEQVSAGDLLNLRTAPRKIFTYNGTAPLAFTADNAGSLPGTITGDEIDYLRGDHSNEQANGGTFRDRDYVLSDVVNSEPFFYNGVVYIGANDAMLHAFDSETGEELFGYVPYIVYDKLDAYNNNGQIDLTEPIYDHQTGFYVDATPHVAEIQNTTYLAAGIGKGGKGVYCLTVDNAKDAGLTASDLVNWEFTEADDPDTPSDLGLVYGRAYVVYTMGGPAVIFGNGYNSDSEEAVLYVMHAADQDGDGRGDIMHKFQPEDGTSPTCNGMSSPAIIDYDLDGIVDYVFAGDLNGNMWKFDLTGAVSDWTATSEYNGQPLFQAKDPDGYAQPITSEPDVMFHCNKGLTGFLVLFGTGKLLGNTDLADNSPQTFYGIYDWERDGETATHGYISAETVNAVTGYTEATLSGGSYKLLRQDFLYDYSYDTDGDTVGDQVYRKTTDYEINYYNPGYTGTDNGNHVGWYYHLPSGEKLVANPLISDGVVTIVSNKIVASACKGSGFSYLYYLDACDGGVPDKPQFDTNNDKKFDENDEEGTTGKEYDTILYRPVQVGDTQYMNDTLGGVNSQDRPSNPIGVKYWHLIE